MNETPVIDSFSFDVNELAPNNTLVGTVFGSDPDIGQEVFYYLTASNDNRFGGLHLDSITGEITVIDSSQLDYEITPVYYLQVGIKDNYTPSLFSFNDLTIHRY